jgi:hypothetical protein
MWVETGVALVVETTPVMFLGSNIHAIGAPVVFTLQSQRVTSMGRSPLT